MRRMLPVMVALAAVLASSPALAQWKAGGVALPITPLDDVSTLLPDGQGGAYFLFIPHGAWRRVLAQHVLADGTIDPLDGATGQTVGPAPFDVGDFRAVVDGGTGALVAFQRCGPPAAHTRCYENGENRIGRWQAGGVIPPWPDSGASIGPCWPHLVAPPLVSAGDGGAILLFDDVVARWAGDGTTPWTPDPGQPGVRVCTSTGLHRNVAIAPDGAGGAWALWDEDASYDPNTHELRFNHVRPNGTRAFGGTGADLAASVGLTARGIRSDGAGGAYVTWSVPGVASGDSVLVTRLDPNGDAMWLPDGVPLGRVPSAEIVPGGDDEIFYASADAGGRRRVQKMAAGALAWPGFPDGVAIGDPGIEPVGLALQPGPGGSVFVAWTDARSGSPDAYVTLLDAAGQPAPGWTLAGTALAGTPDDEYVSGLVPGANAGEVIVSWWRPSALVSLRDLVVQKVTTLGVLAVPPPPAALALAPPWPNPSRDGWTVRFALPQAGRADLELFDVAGRRVWSDSRELGSAGPAQVRIGTRGLAGGVYRLRLRSAAGERTRALVLMR